MEKIFTCTTQSVKILGLGLVALLLFSIQCSSGSGGSDSVAPALVIESLQANPDNIILGNTFELSLMVKNSGNADAAATTLTYYRSDDSTIDTTDTAEGSDVNIPVLGPNDTNNQSTTITPMQTGIYYYGACVAAVTDEVETANNCSGGIQITVVAAVDVDDDNNGLIEIRNLDMLNNMRHNLAGTSYKTSSSATGDTTGAPTEEQANCDDGDANTTVTLCGYELTRDLDFAQEASYESSSANYTGKEWRPTANSLIVIAANGTNSGWSPIGDSTAAFTAVFDGNGYSISNLYSRHDTTSEKYIGLFGGISGTVRNIGVTDFNIYGNSGDDNVGGLAGRNEGTIQNSYATGGTASGGGGGDQVGGLAGSNFTGTIQNSYATGAVDGGAGATDYVGGLVGWNYNGTITMTYATGTASGGAGATDRVGGLVGLNHEDTSGVGVISYSYATGAVNGGAGDSDYVGGLAGRNTGAGIQNSYAAGTVDGGTGTTDYIGGLVGFNGNSGTISSSYQNSAITPANGGTPFTHTGSTTATVATLQALTLTGFRVRTSAYHAVYKKDSTTELVEGQ